MAQVVIIGAGLTGLSTAYHLEQYNFFDYHLFEKETEVGGLCRSIEQDGFTFDFTGHLLHTSDPYFRSFIDTIVGLDQLNVIDRKSYIYSHDTYTHYPFQINLHGLPQDVIVECIEGFITRKCSATSSTSFYEWVLEQFGAGFARHFFAPYQQKIFDFDIHKLSASWTQRFVPPTSLRAIIQGALTPIQHTNVGYNANFLYPKEGGIISWVQALANRLHNPIHTHCTVHKIDLKKKVVYFNNGQSEPFEYLISTMPLDILLSLLEEPASSSLAQARHHLRCNSVINFNLGINQNNLSEKHWIYFPEEQYPFYRLGFPHNFSSSMTPPDCSSLYGEFSALNRSPAWIEQQLNASLCATKELLRIHDDAIIMKKIIHIEHAFVIYDFWRDKNIATLHQQLHEQKVYSIGRYGHWKYSSMQEAILDGKEMAETVTKHLT